MARPRVHFTAESGWINDPHGVTFRDGQYHLFHQYVPGSGVWAPNCHWGHAVSTDLLTWHHRDVALAPGEGDDGIWTGSLVVDREGRARILYTSVVLPDIGMGRIRVAHPTDETWDSWRKGEVLIEPPTDLDLIAYRDPFVVAEGEGWRMYVGAGTREGDALALTYTSQDLETWEFEGIAAERSTHEREPVWTGALWECPQIVDIDCRTVLVSSVWDDDVLYYAGYGVGALTEPGRFEASSWRQLSHGRSYYAPSFFRDEDGRPCLMFWMRGVSGIDAEWTSALSLPYVLGVDGEALVAELHPSVAEARSEELQREDDGSFIITDRVVDLEWTPAAGARLVLSAQGTEVASVEVAAGCLVLTRAGEDTWDMPHDGGALRVVIDGPVIEVVGPHGVLGGAIAPADALIADSSARAWPLS